MDRFLTYSKLGKNGRLGNQLFQIAQTIGMQVNSDMKYFFPRWEYQKYFKSELPSLDVGFQTNEMPSTIQKTMNLSYEDIMKLPMWRRRKHMIPNQNTDTYKTVNSSVIIRNEYVNYKESNPPLPYNTPCPKFSRSTDLLGYFQSERYFKHCRELVQNQFELKDEYKHQIMTECNYSDYTSIHVRRGDYLNKCYDDVFYVQDMNYYNEQIDVIEKKYTNAKFMIFSDDIPWCKQNFKGDKFIFSEKRDVDLFDLIRMSLCQNNIIQNSSFSWWGQWLNKNPSKTVVIPKNFFKPNFRKPEHNTELYCEGWIII